MPSEPDVLTVSTTVHGTDRAVVAISGQLDGDTAAVLQHQLAALTLQGRRFIVLDLALVPFMDSSGLNSVLRARSALLRHEGQLLLAAPSEPVRRLLDLTGISLATPLHDSTDLALAAFPAEEAPPRSGV
ncbi:STAS domain-containing protein [Streptacidiphilus sp. N1-12]|uniref:Anti-sigma factor antagonist n=2 Tax=Streptacidiphilus alkalitolerans TaxID=3342712 RepID=A0ABV6XBE1_9ACTN